MLIDINKNTPGGVFFLVLRERMVFRPIHITRAYDVDRSCRADARECSSATRFGLKWNLVHRVQDCAADVDASKACVDHTRKRNTNPRERTVTMAPENQGSNDDRGDLRDQEHVRSVMEGVVHDRIRFGRESGLDPVECRTCVEEIQHEQNHHSATIQNPLFECLCDVRHGVLRFGYDDSRDKFL